MEQLDQNLSDFFNKSGFGPSGAEPNSLSSDLSRFFSDTHARTVANKPAPAPANINSPRVEQSKVQSESPGQQAPSPSPRNDRPQAPTWEEVLQKPEFQALPEADKAQAKRAYFDYWIAPGMEPTAVQKVRERFMVANDKAAGIAQQSFSPVKVSAPDAQIEGVGVVDPMTGIDPAGLKSATGSAAPSVDPALRGSVMASAPAGAAPKSSTLPVNERFRMLVERAYDAASPEQRKVMEKIPGTIGILVRERNEQFDAHEARNLMQPYRGAGVFQVAGEKQVQPVTINSTLADSLDPRAEARARRLAADGMDASLTESWAKTAAARGTTPGDEVGSIGKTDFDFDAQKKFNEDPFYSNPVVRGAVKGFEGYKQGVLGINQFMAEAVGADEAAAGQAVMAQASRKFTGAMGDPKGRGQRNFEGAVSSIAQQIPALIGGAVTGSQPLVLSTMFVQSFGQEYGEGRSRGQSPEQATARAAQFAALEVIGEKFGLRDSLAGIKAAAKGNVDAAIRSFTQALVKEVPGEQLTTVGQFGVDKEGAGIGLNTEAGVRDLVSQMADTLVQTVMQSGLMIGGGKAVGTAVSKLNTPERQIAREIQNAADTAQIDSQAVDAAARVALDPQSNDAQIVSVEQTANPQAHEVSPVQTPVPGTAETAPEPSTPREPVEVAPAKGVATQTVPSEGVPSEKDHADGDGDLAYLPDFAREGLSPDIEKDEAPALPKGRFSPEDLLDFANARYEQLLAKRDSAKGLNQAELWELDALTERHGNPGLLSAVYGAHASEQLSAPQGGATYSGNAWDSKPKTEKEAKERRLVREASTVEGNAWDSKPKTEREVKERRLARDANAVEGKNLGLFSRSKIDFGAVPQNVSVASAFAVEEVDRTVETIRTAFARQFGRDMPVRLEKIRQFRDLPTALQNAAHAQHAGDAPKGAFFEGTVYVIQDAHTSPKDIEATVFHELYGHAATRRLFGSEWVAKQNALLQAIGGANGLTKLARSSGIDLRDYMRGLAADSSLTDDMRRAVVMDELLAHIAEQGPSTRQKVKEYLGAIRNWLRTHGFARLARYNDTDLAYLLKQAKASLGKATAADAIPALFNRGKNFGDLTPDQERALANVGGIQTRQSTVARVADLKDRFKKRAIQQNLVDQFAPLMDLSQEAYIQARLTKAADGTLEAAMLYGKPFLRDGVPDVNIHDEGFAKVLASLKGEHDRFLWWVAAQRAERLKAAGLENLFGDADIAALKTLYQGNFKDGTPRAQVYIRAMGKLNAFNDAILELAEKSGLVDGDTRKLFKDAPYVPFFREKDGEMSVPSRESGLAGQYAFKKLKGGRDKLHHDLLANVLMNWAHLYSAAAKNRAAVESMKAAVQAKIALEVPAGTRGAVKVMKAGKPVHYLIDDPYVMEAITALNYVTPDFLKPLSTFKRWLTIGVTVNPTFKVRNLMRDSIAAVAQADLSPMIAPNLAKGWKSTRKDSQTFASMLAAGGVIRFGSLVEDNRARRALELIKHTGGELLDENGWKKLTGQIQAVWSAYQEFGDRLENINRAALYERLVQKGYSHAEASFMARDLLDFTMSGKMPLVRFLAQSVPFLNARMQGLYKLGRAAQSNPYRFWATVGAVSMASLGLMLAFQDDDEWKKREDWDRDTYWWFRIGNKAYRIPKPFEVGAFGTLAERTWELMFNKEMTGRRYRDRLSAMLFQTFAFDPTPQIIKPILDVYANRDSFTGRQIEGAAMERLRPEDRYDERTTSTAIFLGQLGLPDPVHLAKGEVQALSPKQIDFMIRGYFGWLGATLVSGVDFGLRPFQTRGVQPSRTLKDTFFVGNFVEELPAGSSRYVTQMYEQAKEVEKVFHSYNDALQRGERNKAQSIRKEEGEKLARYDRIEDAKKEVGEINRRIREIEAHRAMTAQAKRAEIDRLSGIRNRIAQQALRN